MFRFAPQDLIFIDFNSPNTKSTRKTLTSRPQQTFVHAFFCLFSFLPVCFPSCFLCKLEPHSAVNYTCCTCSGDPPRVTCKDVMHHLQSVREGKYLQHVLCFSQRHGCSTSVIALAYSPQVACTSRMPSGFNCLPFLLFRGTPSRCTATSIMLSSCILAIVSLLET